MPQPLRIVLFILTSFLLIGANVFVYRRLIRDVTNSVSVRRLGGIIFVAMLLAVPVVRFAARGRDLPPFIFMIVMMWLGVLLFTLLSLLAFETFHAVARRKTAKQIPVPVVNEERRLFLSRVAATTSLASGVGIATYGTFKAFEKPLVTELPIKLKGLPKALDGFTIVQLTDIHVGAIIQEKFLDQLVEVANSCKPDVLAITGDLVDGSPEHLGKYVARLQRLQSRYGTHFISGNHDYYSGWNSWFPQLESLGFTVLQNRFVTLGGIQLLGVNDWHSDYDLQAATKGFDSEAPSVLLAHQPSNIEEVAKAGIGLQLSGHTHGGQIFPANIIGDLIWGSRNAGLSRVENLSVYVSRGCGFVGPPMRVAAPPEIVKIILTA
jgi:uncharacterized protein